MGIADDLGYEYPDRNWFHRVVVALTSTTVGAWLGYHLIPPVDRVVINVTKGKGTITRWFAGVPPIWVSTVGAKTGKKRNSPLFGIPIDGNLALIGTGFGQAPTPAWVYNLEAIPDAIVEYEGVSIAVRGRAATKDENSEVWETAAAIYPGFVKYRERVTHRPIRVFLLEPLPSMK